MKQVHAPRALVEVFRGILKGLVVIMSQDEFDETSYTDPVVDVSTAGNGRKLATQALLRCHSTLL